MPEVLLLCEYSTLSGGEQSMLATLDGVCRAGFSVAAIAPLHGPLAETLAARNIEVISFTVADPAGRHLPQDRCREELARLLGKRRPDLLDANSLSMGRLSGPVVRDLRVPSIVHVRDIVRLSAQAVADVNCHQRLLAVSRATRDFHVAGGLAPEKLHVLYNGVDLTRFRPRPRSGFLHRELGLAPESRLVATIGQVGLRKGLDVLVRAAALLAERLPDVHYLVVGQRWSDKAESRQYEANLRAAAAGGALAGRVHLLGFRRDVECILAEVSLLVHAARQEPLGRVLLEAAASGTPIVATEVGGTREIFPPEAGAACLIPPDDPHALAAAIRDLLADEPKRARLGAAARRRAEAAFDAERSAHGLIAYYRDLVPGASVTERVPPRSGASVHGVVN